MKSQLGLTIIILGIVWSGCKREANTVLLPVPSGSYSYTAYDSSGTPLVQGTLSLKIADSTITGSWQLAKIGNAQNTGPQFGTGDLRGSLHNETLSINLNPGWADNNVFLQGKIENMIFRGSWMWSTFIGPTNGGTFEARSAAADPQQQ